jgi:hypothetical protein
LSTNLWSLISQDDQLKIGEITKSANKSVENHEQIILHWDEKDFDKKDFNKLVRIKHQWIKENFRSDWHKNKENIVSYKTNKDWNRVKTKNWTIIWNVEFLQVFFKDFLKTALEYWNNIIELTESQEHDKSRNSDIKFLLQKIQSKLHLNKIYQLFEWEYINHKNDNSDIEYLREQLRDFKQKANNCIENYKISDSFWMFIEHGSLNYYTRRKTQKDYEEEIIKKSEWLKNKFYGNLWALYWIDKNQPIENLYKEMKIFKASQKSAFLQRLQSGINFTNFQKEFKFIDNRWDVVENFKIVLFSDITEDRYEEMLNLTNQIEKEKNKESRKQLKEKRGKYFQHHLNKYKKFCNDYKDVAMEFWKRKAEIISLQREKVLAERERWYWFFAKDWENNFYINTFDIENSQQAYHELINNKNTKWEIAYYILSSITLRALEKLCFSERSTFSKWNIINKLDEKFIKIQNGSWRKIFKSKKELEEENILIDFFVEVLKHQTNLNLKFKSTQSINILKECKDIGAFEILLKQETYILDEYFISKQNFESILEKYKWISYKITSKDIENNTNKSTFSSWWRDFWEEENKENDYVLRINPEFSISFRLWDKEKYKNTLPFHRKKNNQYFLTMSFSHSADRNYINTAFINEEDRKQSLQDFNDIFNRKNRFDYIYGIDKGTKELVTLWIFKKSNKWLESVNISEKIPVYKITKDWFLHTKTTTKKQPKKWEQPITIHTLAKNPSLFLDEIDNPKIFEKLSITSCLWDLTYAKLIKWKIILNADISTTLNLYKTTAKRSLHNAVTTWKMISKQVLYDNEENVFYYEYENRGILNKEKNLYWKDEFNFLPHKDEFNSLKEEIEFELNEYIKDINSEEDISMQKINNYKNAVSANIVWIITELQKYFEGYICYETLNEQTVKKEFDTFIGNVINEKIYNKLQLNLEVPPILKKFRTEVWNKDIIQHWKILYVNEKNTSSACPVCNEQLLKKDKNWNLSDKNDNEIFKLWWHLSDFENNMKHLTDLEYQERLKNKSFEKANTKKWKIEKNKYNSWILNWKSCDYHMKKNNYGFDFIESWDDLATYNIAKKAKEYLESLPTPPQP